MSHYVNNISSSLAWKLGINTTQQPRNQPAAAQTSVMGDSNIEEMSENRVKLNANL